MNMANSAVLYFCRRRTHHTPGKPETRVQSSLFAYLVTSLENREGKFLIPICQGARAQNKTQVKSTGHTGARRL